MSERKYSVSEIEALRSAIEHKYIWGRYSIQPQAGGSMSRSYREGDKIVAVEQLTRTAMLAGHTAEDLYESERPKVPAAVTTGMSENGVG